MRSAKKIPNREELEKNLASTLDEVQRRIQSVQNRYGVPYSVIREYLEVNTPSLYESLEVVEQSVDTDIFGKVENGSATVHEIIEWRKNLNDWYHIVIEGIINFEEFQTLSQVA